METFLKKISAFKEDMDSFNPWRSFDSTYDCCQDAPRIRLAQLRAYLQERIGQAKYLLVAEAVGYQGAKFSGVPMTSERILLGSQGNFCISDILTDLKPKRTSNPLTAPSKAVQGKGYAEPTATIVWNLIQALELSPREIVLWNIFPFHPYNGEKGRLSNRPPRIGELALGKEFLEHLILLCPREIQIIAIGEKAATVLGKNYPKVRHPANGGASLFKEQFSKLIA